MAFQSDLCMVDNERPVASDAQLEDNMNSGRNWILAPLALCLLLAAGAVEARDVTSQGRTSISIGGGFSPNVISIGGSFGYFIADRLMPGIRYFYTHQTGDVSDGTEYSVDQHDANLFCRYYVLDEGSVFPFIMGDVGYLQISQEGESVENNSWSMYSIFAGGGGVAFLSPNFAIEAIIGWREYQKIPDEVFGIESGLEWTLGFGLYF